VRSDSDGNETEYGTYATIKYKYSYCDDEYWVPDANLIIYSADRSTRYKTVSLIDSEPEGTGTVIIGGELDSSKTYTFLLRLEDEEVYVETTTFVSVAFFTMDVLKGGHGIAFGQPCTETGFHVAMDAYFTGKVSGLIDLIHPVGSIYWSTESTSPEELFGGAWEQITDTFILAAGDTYTAGNTGGSSTKTLTSANMPSHSHSFTPKGTISGGAHTHEVGYKSIDRGSGSTGTRCGPYGSSTESGNVNTHSADHTHTFSGTSGTTGSTGSGTAFDIMPPYMVAYCWKRTA